MTPSKGHQFAELLAMRIPRSIQLHDLNGFLHSYWRCHNKEYYLKDPRTKALYLNSLLDAFKTHNKDNSLKMHAFTCMDNHFHNLLNYTQGSQKLSNFYRQSHSLFGSRYNRYHNRSGKVSEARPKTSLIENTEHLMRAHFYIEANPIRAGKCSEKQLRGYKFSSYRFYAYGIKDEWTHLLTIPDWYMELGQTALQRQHRYRTLFFEYLMKKVDRTELYTPFVGSPLWRLRMTQKVTEMVVSHTRESPG
jgi:putative transposase